MSTYRLAREFCLHTGTVVYIAKAFILPTIILALAFPTVVSSMAGYVTDTGPFIEVSEGNMIPFRELGKVANILHDGQRLA